MKRPLSPGSRLAVEPLEDRLTPSWGTPWPDATRLTLSFLPDGAGVSGSPSNLSSLLGSSDPAGWQREILRAYQTWAVQANINVGLVADGGQPMGTSGAPEGDPRFGDIRVGARDLTGVGADSLANTVGFDYGAGTWSGDMILNNQAQFSVAGSGSGYDLFSVALHEASHSFGLADQHTDPTSVLWDTYQHPLTGLASSDVAALQGLYGARQPDLFDAFGGNGSIATATPLGGLTAVTADVTTPSDVDVYKFTTPSASSGNTGLTVNLKAAGVSLLVGKLTVYDASGNVVGTAAASDPLANDVAVKVPNYQPNATYYARVEGATSDVFAVGSYKLQLNYQPNGSGGPGFTFLNADQGDNDTLGGAKLILPSGSLTHFGTVGSVSTATDVDYYKVYPWALSGFTGTLTVSVNALEVNGLLPQVGVYTPSGQQLAANVITNDNGTFAIQVPNVSTGTALFLRVAAADPTGARATGNYILAADLKPGGPLQFDSLNAGTLTAATSTAYSTMTVSEGRVVEFSLSADPTAVASATRMSIFDATGKRVFTLVAVAGQPQTTGTVWLPAGTYTVVFNAATRTGAPLPALAFSFSKRELSDPIDPYTIDPGGTTDTSGTTAPVITTTDTSTTPVGVVTDPISNPFLGM